jgi:transposase
MLACRREIERCKRQLESLCAEHEVIQAQAAATGVVTACVLWVHLGDPRKYDSGPAYRKAMGLNLKERSSGKWAGQLKITKRGPSEVRRWLYFAALRWIKKQGVHDWYEVQKSRRVGDRAGAMRAVVGVMRKLALALYQVGACGATFDAALLFPGAPSSRLGRAAMRAGTGPGDHEMSAS